MAVLFLDSFDHYTALVDKWSAIETNQGTPNIQAGIGRNGSGGLTITDTNLAQTRAAVAKTLKSVHPTVTVGCAASIALGTGTDTILLEFLDAPSVSGGGTQVDLRITPAGKFYFTRNGTQIGLQSVNSYPSGPYKYIEAQVTVDSVSGSAEVMVNGVSWLVALGNTKGASGTGIGVVKFGGSAVTASHTPAIPTYDDLYIADTTGLVNTTYLGDIVILALLPKANGILDQFTASTTGTANWAEVAENPPDGDATYVDSSLSGALDLYRYPALPYGVGTIPAIQLLAYAKKLVPDALTIRNLVTAEGTIATSEDIALDVTFNYKMSVSELDPDTGKPWTIVNVNMLQAGPQVGAVGVGVLDSIALSDAIQTKVLGFIQEVVSDAMTLSDDFSKNLL